MVNSMLHMGKILRSKLRSSFGKEGRHGSEEVMSGLMVTTNVNAEYKEAFRTKSYTEIYNKFRGQLETKVSLDDEGQSLSFSSPSSTESSPPSPPMEQVHLLQYLVEPRQETLISILESSKYHHFLETYFDISLEAGRICESILENIHQVHIDYHTMRNVIELIERTPDHTNWSQDQYNWLYRNLASFSSESNPFPAMTPEKFHELHESQVHLYNQLKSQCRKTRRRAKITRFIKRALAIVGCGALAVASLVVAMHGAVGVVAAPGLIICCLLLLMMKKLKRGKRDQSKEKQLEGVGAQLDVAARGVYTLINDFDTMGGLVKTLHEDEMERKKFAAEICARQGKNKWALMKEVATEIHRHASWFQERLEELEQQIFLSFLDINRSRRLVLREMEK